MTFPWSCIAPINHRWKCSGDASLPLRTQSLSCWLLSPWIPIAGHLTGLRGSILKSIQLQAQYKKQSCCEQHFNSDTYPSLLILLVRSSQRLFVSTKMMVLFSFSLIISSRRRMSLKKNFKRQNKTFNILQCHVSSSYYENISWNTCH